MSVPVPLVFRTIEKGGGFVADADPHSAQSLVTPSLGVPGNVPQGGSAKTTDVALTVVGLDANGDVVTTAPGTVTVELYEVLPGRGDTAHVILAGGGTTVITANAAPTLLTTTPGQYVVRLTAYTLAAAIETVHLYVKFV